MPTLLALAFAAGTARAAPSAADLALAWDAVKGELSAGQAGALGAKDLETLAAGRTISRRRDDPAGAVAFGAIVAAVPVDAFWVAIHDARHDPDAANPVTSTWLDGGTPTSQVVYMTMQLPWPITDRQWVCALRADPKVFAATGGKAWRRTWNVGDPTLAPAPDPDATWVTENSGSWVLIPVGDHTLAVFETRTVLGGAIPEPIAQGWAVRALDDSLKLVASRAARMPAHYDAAHDTLHRPDGTALAPGLPRP